MNLTMQINRKMVTLFFEIKRNMPYEHREKMKIASPDLAQQLTVIYKKSKRHSLKESIEKFMSLAGDEYLDKLKAPKKPVQNYYRGSPVVKSSSRTSA